MVIYLNTFVELRSEYGCRELYSVSIIRLHLARNTAIMVHVDVSVCFKSKLLFTERVRYWFIARDLFGHNAIFSPVPAVVVEIQLINIGYAAGFMIKTYHPIAPGTVRAEQYNFDAPLKRLSNIERRGLRECPSARPARVRRNPR